MDGIWLEKKYDYINGAVSEIKYKSSTSNNEIVTQNYLYQNGHLIERKLNGSNSVWKLNSENNLGMPVQVTSGILSRTYEYDQYGLPTARKVVNGSKTIQHFTYKVDPLTNNLSWRKDNTRNIQEDFTYDKLNRLVTFNGTTLTYDTNGKGNITANSSIGQFTYGINKPYQLIGSSHSGSHIPLRNQQITYNTLLRPTTITENGINASFVYNESGERLKMLVTKNNNNLILRYYLGGQYEIESGVTGNKEILYLDGDAYSASFAYVKENNSWSVYYICRDYLGNITHIVNSAGVLKQELSYNAWGQLRNPVNQTLYASDSQPVLFLTRGYTGHEHLPWFGLINMNARLYDPVLGRFLSPDPFVQAPFFSQNFNRYSYALNNPLKFTDPDGEFIVSILVGAAIGAGISALSYSTAALASGNWDLKDLGKSVGMGAVGGALGAGFSYLGSAIGVSNSFGYGVMSQMGNNVATNALFGNDLISVNSVIGAIVGGGLATILPQYNAIEGSNWKNFISETGINTGRGALMGMASGIVMSPFNRNNPNIVWQNILGGAFNGLSSTLMTQGLFGIGQYYDDSAIFGTEGSKPIYRNSGVLSTLPLTGISWGRTAWANKDMYEGDKLIAAYNHEGTHWRQQQKDGFGRFYGKTTKNYASSIIKYGSATPLYNFNANYQYFVKF